MVYGIADTVNQYLRERDDGTKRQDRRIVGRIYIDVQREFCGPLVGAFRSLGSCVRTYCDEEYSVIRFDSKLSSLSGALLWIDMLPSPSVLKGALSATQEWAACVDMGRRFAYDYSPDSIVSEFFKDKMLDNYAMPWMAHLTAGKPGDLRKLVGDVRYTDTSLVALERDEVGKSVAIICENPTSEVSMHIVQVGNKKIDSSREVIGMI